LDTNCGPFLNVRKEFNSSDVQLRLQEMSLYKQADHKNSSVLTSPDFGQRRGALWKNIKIFEIP
jgi:hypothetical protein